MLRNIVGICLIYGATVIAWMILGGTVDHRTDSQDAKLRSAVGQLWGRSQIQVAPEIKYFTEHQRIEEVVEDDKTTQKIHRFTRSHTVAIQKSDIVADIDLDHRRKGLQWYSTYKVHLAGAYTIQNNTDGAQDFHFTFKLPVADAIYDHFSLEVGKEQVDDIRIENGFITHVVALDPGQQQDIRVGYSSRGLDEWKYRFGKDVNQIKNFTLTVTTDFDDIDFPVTSISPTEMTKQDDGWALTWSYDNLLTGVQVGLAMPQKLNPGPWVSQVTYSAPISLFLFFFLIFIFTQLRAINLHPMNYFFLAAAFFSFHLLLAYLVDHISIHVAFLICSAVSIFLVISYMRLVVGAKFALLEVGVSQFVYLVLFSYTFFFYGYTGLSITILTIITLFVVMQMTGKLDWHHVFAGAKVTPEAERA